MLKEFYDIVNEARPQIRQLPKLIEIMGDILK